MPGCRLNGFEHPLSSLHKKELLENTLSLRTSAHAGVAIPRIFKHLGRKTKLFPFNRGAATPVTSVTGSQRHTFLTAPFLVRERGLEPPRHNHTHLKRACLPFQHSRKCLSIIPYLPHFVNPFFREPGGRHFPRSDSHSRGRAATGSGFCSPPGTGAPGWRR